MKLATADEPMKRINMARKNPHNIIIVDDLSLTREMHAYFCKEAFPTATIIKFRDSLSAWDILRSGTINFYSFDIIITEFDKKLLKNIKEGGIQIRTAVFSNLVKENEITEYGIDIFVNKPAILQLYSKLLWQ